MSLTRATGGIYRYKVSVIIIVIMFTARNVRNGAKLYEKCFITNSKGLANRQSDTAERVVRVCLPLFTHTLPADANTHTDKSLDHPAIVLAMHKQQGEELEVKRESCRVSYEMLTRHFIAHTRINHEQPEAGLQQMHTEPF